MVAKLPRKWKGAAVGVRGLDPDKVEHEFTKLARTGSLTPEAVVEAASDPESPLHDGFTWDDSVAGQKWRLHEAARIIRALVFIEETPTGEREVRCFVNVKDPDEETDATTKGYYIETGKALSNEKYRQHVLETALADAQAFADKYRDLSELARIVRAIDTTVREFERAHATA